MWAKKAETDDLISYEKKHQGRAIRIEARLVNGKWEIYKTYHRDEQCDYVEEYKTDHKQKALDLIETLKKEKDLTLQEINKIKKFEGKKINLKLKRAYKEYDVEKWYFSINNEGFINFVVARYAEEIHVDIVLHEKYRYYESKILDELDEMLKLADFGHIHEHVYFFKKHTAYNKKSKRGYLMGKIEMDIGFE